MRRDAVQWTFLAPKYGPRWSMKRRGWIRQAGFQGVQWDYEACPDNDRSFLMLLRQTGAALPPGAILSVAAPVLMPPPLGPLGWSERYFGEVSSNCDQITVMCYDTGAVLPRAYVWLVGQQVIHVTHAVAASNPACRVLFGLPTYRDGTLSHSPHAENLAMGLRGVQDGLASGKANLGVFSGIAPFADYTTDEQELSLLARAWPLQTRRATSP